MRGLMMVLLWVVVLAQAAVLYMGYQREQALSAEVASLRSEMTSLRQNVAQQRKKLVQIEQQSVSAMVAKANKVIVEGWDAIVDSVESEMVRARKALTELDEEQAAGDPASGAQNVPSN
ncbi:hypothetical protein [Gilvimarinus agarilyticus]|uniref:hypothetical protein n=1 Tax=Gilvimarinus agarilyticus TaxID=679259 RepID=UPI00059FA4DE|nr:hypothetical protein [Gilvimarinus agarilyticus]